MITVMKRALPGDLSRDIRRGRALRSGGRTDDRSGAGAGGLAPGWKETTAPDGRTYYFNDKGETSWEKPVDPSAATSSRAESKPKKGAIVAAVKPVIPGVAGLGKLPQGWRMLTGEDGRSYYYNKKTGETSWDPPPPDAGGDGGGEGEGGMEALGNMIKDGWRRTKQTAAVKVQGKGTTETHDPELEASYERVLQVLRQMEGVKNAMESCAAPAQFGAQFFGAHFWRNSLTPPLRSALHQVPALARRDARLGRRPHHQAERLRLGGRRALAAAGAARQPRVEGGGEGGEPGPRAPVHTEGAHAGGQLHRRARGAEEAVRGAPQEADGLRLLPPQGPGDAGDASARNSAQFCRNSARNSL